MQAGPGLLLSCIYLVLHISLNKVQVAAYKGLVKWLLACSAATHLCRWCTRYIVRTLNLTTQSQIRWQVDSMGKGEEEKGVELLRECGQAAGQSEE